MAAMLLLFVGSEGGERTPVEVPIMATAGDVLRVYSEMHGLTGGSLHFEGKELECEAVLADAGVCSQATVHFVRRSGWKPPNAEIMKAAVDMLSKADWQVTAEIAAWMKRENEGGEDRVVTHFSIEDWDTSGITEMQSMFDYESEFNQDISSWNVSAVTDMNYMFYDASSFDQDLSSWNVSAVTDMSYMFLKASSFNQDISSWNVSAVDDMSTMFGGASSFNQDLSSWNVSAVTDMSSMFEAASLFNQDLSQWDGGFAKSNKMFDGAMAEVLPRWYR